MLNTIQKYGLGGAVAFGVTVAASPFVTPIVAVGLGAAAGAAVGTGVGK